MTGGVRDPADAGDPAKPADQAVPAGGHPTPRTTTLTLIEGHTRCDTSTPMKHAAA